MKPLTKQLTVSPKGLDFDNQPLQDHTLQPGQLVSYRKRLYGVIKCINRAVELCDIGGRRAATVSAKNVRLVENQLR